MATTLCGDTTTAIPMIVSLPQRRQDENAALFRGSLQLTTSPYLSRQNNPIGTDYM